MAKEKSDVNPLYTAAVRLIKLRDAGKISKAEFDKEWGAEKHMVKKAKGGVLKANRNHQEANSRSGGTQEVTNSCEK